MRKILASFLATAMITSIGATLSFAASNASFNVTLNSGDVLETTTTDTALDAATIMKKGTAKLSVSTNTGDAFVFESQEDLAQGADKDAIAKAFNGAEARARIGGTIYTVKLTQDKTTKNQLNAAVSPAGLINFSINTAAIGPLQGTSNNGTLEIVSSAAPVIADMSQGTGGVNPDNDADRDYVIGQMVHSNGNTPIALVDNANLINDNNDGVKSGSTVYFLLNEPYSDSDLFKVRASKGENSKNVKSIDVIEKHFSKDLIEVTSGRAIVPVGGKRVSVIKVELKELFTDDEYKITFDLRVSPTDKGAQIYQNFSTQTFKESDIGTVWLKNSVAPADNEFRVGLEGLMLQPLSNDHNEIIWFNEESDLAKLNFFADSDVGKFYSKLSTKWEHTDYAAYFNDQDAYMFEFTGSPKLSATSRADLDIYNPFMDQDENETVDPQNVVIYQVVDGDLVDITDQFTYGENEDGYMAFSTRTRFLGTYILAEKAVEIEGDAQPEELPEEDGSSKPDDNTQGGNKAPANTGRYA